MDMLAYTAAWVLGSVFVGVTTGYYLGKSRVAEPREKRQLDNERQAILKSMVELLHSAERMSSDVECHNSEIRQTAQRVSKLNTTGELSGVKETLIDHMASLLRANQQLERDLDYSRYKIDEQAQEIDLARREARTDALTSIGNRKAFDEKLHCLLVDWEKHRQPFALILVDLDYFKRINDAHGHQAGDEVLARVGDWLKEWVPEAGFVGRYGGDEFGVLLPNTDAEAGAQSAETIRSRGADRASRVAVRDGQVSVSFSIGVADSRPGDTTESILRRADEGLYQAKRMGRNQVHVGQSAESEPSPEEICDQNPTGVPV